MRYSYVRRIKHGGLGKGVVTKTMFVRTLVLRERYDSNKCNVHFIIDASAPFQSPFSYLTLNPYIAQFKSLIGPFFLPLRLFQSKRMAVVAGGSQVEKRKKENQTPSRRPLHACFAACHAMRRRSVSIIDVVINKTPINHFGRVPRSEEKTPRMRRRNFPSQKP